MLSPSFLASIHCRLIESQPSNPNTNDVNRFATRRSTYRRWNCLPARLSFSLKTISHLSKWNKLQINMIKLNELCPTELMQQKLGYILTLKVFRYKSKYLCSISTTQNVNVKENTMCEYPSVHASSSICHGSAIMNISFEMTLWHGASIKNLVYRAWKWKRAQENHQMIETLH